MSDELEELKKRKLAAMQQQYQAQMQQQVDEEQQAQQQIAALEDAVKKRLSKDALQRYGNIKTANPERAVQLLVILGRLIQLGKLNSITDDTLKAVLDKMSSEKRQTTITRK